MAEAVRIRSKTKKTPRSKSSRSNLESEELKAKFKSPEIDVVQCNEFPTPQLQLTCDISDSASSRYETTPVEGTEKKQHVIEENNVQFPTEINSANTTLVNTESTNISHQLLTANSESEQSATAPDITVVHKTSEEKNNVTYSELLAQVHNLKLDEEADSVRKLLEKPDGTAQIGCPEIAEKRNELTNKSHTKVMTIHRKIVSTQSTTLYPELLCSRTFTESQLESLYHNPELEANEAFVTSFIEANSNACNHEFRELLLNYLRSRVKLLSTSQGIAELEKFVIVSAKHLWDTNRQTVVENGKCQDGTTVTAEHSYHVAIFDKKAASEIKQNLMVLRDKLHEAYCFNSYAAQVAKLQVEVYLHKLLHSMPELENMQSSAPIQAYLPDRRPAYLTEYADKLNCCISILFSVQRRPAKDDQFIINTRIWLSKLVSFLLRIATFNDHLFILNHVLRCPAGVSKWGGHFIQIPQLPIRISAEYGIFGCAVLDHAVTVLATLLQPIRDRDNFLLCMKVTPNDEDCANNESNVWVLLDSDGEEDDDPSKCWLHWQENDLVSFLNQIPFGEMYKFVLGVQTRDDVDLYDTSSVTEEDFYRLLAFSTCVIKILKQGLHTFSLVRYKQFTKRICQLIRHSVMYISDHWEIFQAVNQKVTSLSRERLQAEYDQFFLRATCSIFSSQRLGAWQFMAAMPFGCISVKMLWKILWVLQNGYNEVNHLLFEQDLNEVCWQEKCEDPHVKLKFQELLCELPDCEAYYLVTTLSNIACSRDMMDRAIVEFIAKEVFQISYLHRTLRDSCAKWGRELLATICTKHVFVISVLLNEVKNTITEIGMVSIYLFSELPIDLWHPTEDDLKIIEGLLLSRAVTSSENQFARVVLSSMNWDSDDTANYLYLEWETHRKVGLLIVEATRVHLLKNQGLLSKGFQQITYYASLMKSSTPEHVFIEWAWEMMRTLRLHLLQLPDVVAKQCLSSWDISISNIPDFREDVDFASVRVGIEEKQTLALYAALVMTTAGHSVAGFCQSLDLLHYLIENQSYEAVLRSLSCICPLFFNNGQYLWTNNRFLEIVQAILAADQTYMKVVKNLVMDGFPGKVLSDFANMIEFQLTRAPLLGFTPGSVTLFWIRVITETASWTTNRSALFILDTLLQTVVLGPDCLKVQEIFAGCLKHREEVVLKDVPSRPGSAVTNFFSWMVTGSAGEPPTLISRQFASEFFWYTYTILELESLREESSGMWQNLLAELANCKTNTVDVALKRTLNGLEGTNVPVHHLAIYRWAWQSLNVPVDHPLVALYWQKFFSLFLQRTHSSNRRTGGSVGERFFDGMKNLSLLKKMKRRLKETTDYYSNLILTLKRSQSEEAQDCNLEKRQQFLERFLNLIRTFSLWLEEPRLHEANLHLPALLLPYNPTRLALIFQNNKVPWLEFVDFDKVWKERMLRCKKWELRTPKRKHSPVVNNETPMENVLSRLRSYEAAVPPLAVSPIDCLVPMLPKNAYVNSDLALSALKPHIDILVKSSKDSFRRFSQHRYLDECFLKLAPNLYKNIPSEVVKHVACVKKASKGGSVDALVDVCKGPAKIKIKFKQRHLIESVNKQMGQNRIDWKCLLEELKPLPSKAVCIATVFLENAVMDLLESNAKLSKKPQCSANKQLRDIGLSIFYYLSNIIDEEIKMYPPSRHFLSSSIEVLGQEFVNDQGDQCEKLLDTVLMHPQWVGWLAHLFCPNSASSETFIKLYRRVASSYRNPGPDLAFVVLTKFDISGWLTKSKPKLSEVTAVVEIAGSSLRDMGCEVASDLLMLHEIYRQHLRALFTHQLPDHFGDVFRLLLNGSDSQDLSVDVWNDILTALLSNDNWHPGMCMKESSKVFLKYSQEQSAFTLQQFQETLQILQQHFMEHRFRSKDSAHFGLYTTYKPYIGAIASLLGVMGFGYVVSVKHSVKGTIPDEVLLHIWDNIWGAYKPWIEPFTHNGCVFMPWLASENNVANIMVSGLTEIIRYVQESLYTNKPILAFLLDCYANIYVNQSVKSHVFEILHLEFAELPWSNFWPDITSVGKMVSISYCGLEDCVGFLGSVFTQINWPQLVQHYMQTYMHSLVVDLHVCLLNLLVMLSFQPAVRKSSRVSALLEAAHVFQWQLIDSKMFQAALGSFLSHCNPFFILEDDEKTRMERDIMSLLQSVSGFVVAFQGPNPETHIKCVHFIQANCQLLCTCASKDAAKFKEKAAVAKQFIKALVQRIEAVIVTGSSAAITQITHSAAYFNDVFTILNVTANVTLQEVTVSALEEWSKENARSPINTACLRIITSRLACAKHVVILLETFVESYFTTIGHEEAGWDRVLSAVSIPELIMSQVILQCVSSESLLSLYAFMCQQHVNCKTLEEELQLLLQMTDAFSSLKPTEKHETKVLLILCKMLDLATRQVDFNGNVVEVTKCLFQLGSVLSLMGDDRTGSGFLSVIGLGKKSSLSAGFRLVARAMSAFVICRVSKWPSGAAIPSKTVNAAVQSLESAINQKQYQAIRGTVEYMCALVKDESVALADFRTLLKFVCREFFPEKLYLTFL